VSQGFHLTASFFESPGAVDGIGSVAKFFGDGELCVDASASVEIRKAARAEALHLLLGSAPGNYKAVEIFGEAGFDEQGSFYKGGVANSALLPSFKLFGDGCADAGMQDGIEAIEFGAVGEDDRGEFGAVDAAVRCGDARAKFLENFFVSGLTWLGETVAEGIRVENGETHFAQHGSDRTFAAGDSSGEAEFQHEIF
jgi:hypothetical protein